MVQSPCFPTQSLVQTKRCPLALVGIDPWQQHGRRLVTSQQRKLHMTNNPAEMRILVGVDGSAGSIAALWAAARIAQVTGARITAVHAWEVPAALALSNALGTVDFSAGPREVLNDAVAKVFGPVPPQSVTTKLIQGNPRDVLLADSASADLLVVGRRGAGGFMGLMLGSVSQACVNHSQCPVLVVGADQASKSRE